MLSRCTTGHALSRSKHLKGQINDGNYSQVQEKTYIYIYMGANVHFMYIKRFREFEKLINLLI